MRFADPVIPVLDSKNSSNTPAPILNRFGSSSFRDYYNSNVRPCVVETYYNNHVNQTLEFVLSQKKKYFPLSKEEMSIWDCFHQLNNMIDESDPDTDLSQLDHALQTAEAIRADGCPRWMIIAGFVHDMGKILSSWGEPQWCTVGDTFPVGCKFSDKIEYHHFFVDNPDSQVPEYMTECGIYSPGCGLDSLHMSFGHDEYMYQVIKDYLPENSCWIVRYHSFYPWHKEGAYRHFMNQRDWEALAVVQSFNKYDLYSKTDVKPDWEKLKPFYTELVAEYFPDVLKW